MADPAPRGFHATAGQSRKNRGLAPRRPRSCSRASCRTGLLEVRLEDEIQDDLFLIEVATYPERRVADQLTGDLLLVYLDRGKLPEAVTLVLRPKGKYRVPRSRNLRSRRGLSSCRLNWHVVELWTIPAEELLQAGDVGLIPWVPLRISPTRPRRCFNGAENPSNSTHRRAKKPICWPSPKCSPFCGIMI